MKASLFQVNSGEETKYFMPGELEKALEFAQSRSSELGDAIISVSQVTTKDYATTQALLEAVVVRDEVLWHWTTDLAYYQNGVRRGYQL